MKEYDFINFSDSYTFIAPSYEVAALVVRCMGNAYGAKSQDETEEVPVFLFGDSRKWYENQFSRSPDDAFEELYAEVADALDSFMLGGFEDRKRYNAALEAIDDPVKKQKFIKIWQDGRSSMNDIGTTAHKLAKAIREELKK